MTQTTSYLIAVGELGVGQPEQLFAVLVCAECLASVRSSAWLCSSWLGSCILCLDRGSAESQGSD